MPFPLKWLIWQFLLHSLHGMDAPGFMSNFSFKGDTACIPANSIWLRLIHPLIVLWGIEYRGTVSLPDIHNFWRQEFLNESRYLILYLSRCEDIRNSDHIEALCFLDNDIWSQFIHNSDFTAIWKCFLYTYNPIAAAKLCTISYCVSFYSIIFILLCLIILWNGAGTLPCTSKSFYCIVLLCILLLGIVSHV